MRQCQHVESYHLVLLLPGAFGERTVIPEAGVVDKYRRGLLGHVEKRLPALLRGEVGGDLGHGDIMGGDELLRELPELIRRTCRYDQVVTLGREYPRDLLPDTSGRAGHNCQTLHAYTTGWCRGRDSNPRITKNRILSPAPFPSLATSACLKQLHWSIRHFSAKTSLPFPRMEVPARTH